MLEAHSKRCQRWSEIHSTCFPRKLRFQIPYALRLRSVSSGETWDGTPNQQNHKNAKPNTSFNRSCKQGKDWFYTNWYKYIYIYIYIYIYVCVCVCVCVSACIYIYIYMLVYSLNNCLNRGRGVPCGIGANVLDYGNKKL